MTYTIILIALSIFLMINIYIIYHDIKYKSIPNKLLWLLLIGAVIFILTEFLYHDEKHWLHISYMFLQIFLSFITVFLLFIFRIWWAGDSKYIFILSLYLTSGNILILFFNTSFFILLYFFSYTVYFYLLKPIISKDFRKTLWRVIKSDIIQSKERFMNIWTWYTAKLNAILFFLLLYLAIRYFRPFVLDYIYTPIVTIIWKEYEQIIILGWVILILWILYLTLQILSYAGRKIENHTRSPLLIKSVILYVSIAFFIFILLSAYAKHPENTIRYLQLAFSIYLIIFIAILLWKYSLYLVFDFSERKLTLLNELEEWMIIDRSNIKHLLKWRENLAEDMEYDPDTKILTQEDIKGLKKTIKYINLCIKRNNKNEDIIHAVITLKSYPFGLYIFLWFTISVLFEDAILQYCIWIFHYFL